jgi:phage-related protein
MGSIYNVNPYGSGTAYSKFDIAQDASVSTRYWYSSQDSNTGNTPSTTSAYWKGNISVTIDSVTSTQPYFFWTPSYNFQVSHQPKTQTIQFGDGYAQRLKDGINNDLLNLNLSFEGRTENEASSIIHFLKERGGFGAFYFKCPAPYSIIKKFVCSNYSSTFVFADNYNLQCQFQEIGGGPNLN